MPFTDYSSFDETYFEGSSVPSPNPAGYANYRREMLPFDFYAQKIHDDLTSQGIDPTGQKVLIVGCAYGYTVEYLVDNFGVDCYGLDISSYAVNTGAQDIAYPERIFLGDVTVQNDIKSVQQQTPGGKFKVIFNECVLECLTDTEAQTAADNMRTEAQTTAVHRVWSADGSDVNPTYYNSKTLAEWQSLVDSGGSDEWYTEHSFQPGGV